MRRTMQQGVTLIELMVAVGILAAVVALSVPGFLDWRSNERAKSTARAVSDAFLLARSQALQTGNNYLVVLGGALGAPDDIVVVNDSPATGANCAIDAGEVVHAVSLDAGVAWGTSATGANGAVAADDDGDAPGNAGNGSTFTDAAGNDATWVLFGSDGLPRTFNSPCPAASDIGSPAEGGGGIYVTNGRRDYAALLLPLGTSRVHRWMPGGSWSN